MAKRQRTVPGIARQGAAILLALLLLAGPIGWRAAAQTTQQGGTPAAQSQPAAAPAATPAQATSPATAQQNTAPPAAPAPQTQIAPPQGTAIAPYEKDTGIAASRPAGAVIAPGKQHRRRSILIRVGLILGAAAAIGTVVGLSAGSSSRP